MKETFTRCANCRSRIPEGQHPCRFCGGGERIGLRLIAALGFTVIALLVLLLTR